MNEDTVIVSIEWHPMSGTEMPEEGSQVLVVTKFRAIYAVHYLAGAWIPSPDRPGLRIAPATITHWCKPQLP